MLPRPTVRVARVKVTLDEAMALVTEESLRITHKRVDEHLRGKGASITQHFAVPMAWVCVPYLDGTEADVAAILSRIAPEAVPLGLCAPGGQSAPKMAPHHKCSDLSQPEEASSLSPASRSGSLDDPLSAAGSGESREEVKFPCADAGSPAADVNAQPEGDRSAALAA